MSHQKRTSIFGLQKSMSDFDSSYVPRRYPGLIHREKGSFHLFLHPVKPRWAVTNRLGREIIELCDGKNTIGLIAATTAKKFATDYAQVEGDAITFVRSLDKANLLLSDQEDSPGALPSPVNIKGFFLHLTERCNLKCIHCYAADHNEEETGLSTRKIHDLIGELADRNGRAVTISGGEPLLRKDWYEILEHACDYFNVTLNTNGTLIDSKSVALLSKSKPLVQISLDGPNRAVHDKIRGKGTFNASISGVRRLLEAGLRDRLVISMTLMKQNIASAPEMISFVEQLGVPKLRFLPLHSQGRARSSWSTLDASTDDYLKWFDYVYYDQTARSTSIEISGGLTGFLLYMPAEGEENWCTIGRRVVIDHTGDMYPCALLMDEEFKLGNVNQVSLEEVEKSSKLRELTSACLSRREKIDKCELCTWRSLCQSGCPALILLEKGSLWETDDFCRFRGRLFEDTIFDVARAKERRSKSVA